jgi:hypothetical protein
MSRRKMLRVFSPLSNPKMRFLYVAGPQTSAEDVSVTFAMMVNELNKIKGADTLVLVNLPEGSL